MFIAFFFSPLHSQILRFFVSYLKTTRWKHASHAQSQSLFLVYVDGVEKCLLSIYSPKCQLSISLGSSQNHYSCAHIFRQHLCLKCAGSNARNEVNEVCGKLSNGRVGIFQVWCHCISHCKKPYKAYAFRALRAWHSCISPLCFSQRLSFCSSPGDEASAQPPQHPPIKHRCWCFIRNPLIRQCLINLRRVCLYSLPRRMHPSNQKHRFRTTLAITPHHTRMHANFAPTPAPVYCSTKRCGARFCVLGYDAVRSGRDVWRLGIARLYTYISSMVYVVVCKYIRYNIA